MTARWRVRIGCALWLIFSGMGMVCAGAQETSEAGPSSAAQASSGQSAVAQSSVVVSPSTASDDTVAALQEMSQLAGVIFTGQVVEVRRLAADSGATGVVEISFAVEEAVRGVSGGTYTVREWAGLWPAGDTPFLVGQRYLMLLHAPSAAGLSSPVGGMDGAIPIRGGLTAAAETSGAQTVGATAETSGVTANTASSSAGLDAQAPDGRMIDLRWVGSRVVRPVVYRTEAGTGTTARLNGGAVAAAATSTASSEASSATSSVAGSALQTAGYSAVLGMLHGWEKATHAAQ